LFTKTSTKNKYDTNIRYIDDHMIQDHNVQPNDENPDTVCSIPSEPVQSQTQQQQQQKPQPQPQQQQPSQDEINKRDLNQALNKATPNYTPEPGYSADDSYSSIQKSKSSGKSGWCYIGEDRGFRSCINVGENDKCMSGDIFPTSDICVNPNLRM